MENPYSLKNILLNEGTSKKEVIKNAIKSILKENVRFDFQKGGGGGKRFIPTNGIVPSKLFTALTNHFKKLGNQLIISPEAVLALTSVERGRGGAINYKELYGKLRGYFDIKKANSSSEFGPAQTSSFLSQFKQGLKGRLESVVTGGKEFKVWDGEGSKNEKGDFVFPLAQFKAASLQENEEGLRSQLHSLVGNEMRLGKRVGMTGASHHEEEHKKAEKAVEDFLRMNPSMEEYRDEVEDYFTKLLFRENKEGDQPGKFEILVSSLAKYLNDVSRDEMFDESGNYNSTLKGYHDELKQYADNGTEEEQLKANFLLGFI